MASKVIFMLAPDVLRNYPKVILTKRNPDGPKNPRLIMFADGGRTELGETYLEGLKQAGIVIPVVAIRELKEVATRMTDSGRQARETLSELMKLNVFASSSTRGASVARSDFMSALSKNGQAVRIATAPTELRLIYEQGDSTLDQRSVSETSFFDGSEEGRHAELISTILLERLATRTYYQNTYFTVLTNDPALTLELRAYGIDVLGYDYEKPTYTGRRSVEMPFSLFRKFVEQGEISEQEFWHAFPEDEPLRPNEFVEMTIRPDDTSANSLAVGVTEERRMEEIAAVDLWKSQNGYFDLIRNFENIGRFDAEQGAIVPIRRRWPVGLTPKNAGQAMYLDSLLRPEIAAVICSGPAGTGKTYFAAVAGLTLARSGEFMGISVVPCNVADSVGFLPGDMSEKMDPRVRPIKNALKNFELRTNAKLQAQLANLQQYGANAKGKNGMEDEQRNAPNGSGSVKARLEEYVETLYSNWFGEPIPVEYARGRDFANEFVIYDEFEDQSMAEADTLIKRLGESGKIVITGDVEQIHNTRLSRENNGLEYAMNMLAGAPEVACVQFLDSEVVRHPLVRYLIEKQHEL